MTFLLPEAPPRPDWPAFLPDHLSASQLSMLERCPEQYRLRYVEGRKEPPGGYAIWGTVDGRAHGVNFTQKIDSGTDLPVGDVQDAFAAILDETIIEECEQGGWEPEQIDWRDDSPATVKDKGVALVAQYHRQVSPRVQPTAVEEPVRLEIPGIAVPFVGYIDVSTADHAIERKTAKAKSETIPPQYRVQTLAYALAARAPVEVHISTRTVKPAVYTPEEFPGLLLPLDEHLVTRVERLITSRARLLLSLVEEFGPEGPWPDGIGTQAWHTHVCDLCGFRDSGCAWWT